jgi:L-lactate dehydrogenase complex protein LldG
MRVASASVSARADILRAVRRAAVEAAPLPPVRPRPDPDDDRSARFAERLREAGGSVERTSRGQLAAAAARIPSVMRASRILSFLPEILPSTAPLDGSDDPRALADVDCALLRAHFGVAENGAVWITDELVAPRSALFLPEHVAVILDARDLVSDMHAAYARLGTTLPAFGCFVAGPSKTADIEQALVIGAHGPRSLAVLLVEPD